MNFRTATGDPGASAIQESSDMLTRIDQEKREYELLDPKAAKSGDSLGRALPEEECSLRTIYQRDRDRIIHSKAFRRLMHKTQVFLAPEGDHFRTRLTHTLEVSQIARTIARALKMNEDLTEAIAMGHDLGHTPFGHNGEEFLNIRHREGFAHNEQSLRVVDVLEKMNLSHEVRDGILNHTGKGAPATAEGMIVRYSDRIAYINHDIDDALRSGVIVQEDLPKNCIMTLGKDHRSRINSLVIDTVKTSNATGEISMSPELMDSMNKLREFMFENVYYSSKVKEDSELEKIRRLINTLYDYYENHESEMPEGWETKDYIAAMTDRYALNKYKEVVNESDR